MARAKKQPTPGDMVRSLAVILLPVLVITFIATRNLNDHPVKVVDWQPVLTQARSEAPYPVLAPTNLPPQWRATSVSWVQAGENAVGGQPSARDQWQLGFLDPEDVNVLLVQGDKAQPDLLADKTRDGVMDGQSTVNGKTWERRLSRDERTRSLVTLTPAVATIVVGDTTYEALEAYVATLGSS